MDITKIQRYSYYKLIILMSALFFLVITINSISLNVNNTYKNDYANRIEVNIKSDFVKQGKLIDLSGIEILKKYFSSGIISYMSELDTVLRTEDIGYPVKAIQAGEKLEDFLGLDILRGTFFSSDQYQYGSKVAVISDTMAQKLFTTHHVIGNEIFIANVKYKIVGLYKTKTSLFSLLTSDGIERVYIPFESLSSNGTQNVNTIFIKDKDFQEEAFKINKIEEILNERLRVEAYRYRINDFYESSIYITQPLSMFIFLIGVFCIFILAKFFVKYLKFGVTYLENGIKSNYFFEILLKWKLRIPLFFIVATLILIFITTVFGLIRFKGLIPYEYIPADNIFDFSFYADKVKDAIYSSNSNVGYSPTQLEILFRNNLIVTYVLMSFLFINFIAVLSTIKLNNMVSESFTKHMLAIGISIFIGLVIAFVFCLTCGVHYSFPFSEVSIIILFFSMKVVDEKKVDNQLTIHINS